MFNKLPLCQVALPLPIVTLREINVYLINADPLTLIDTGLKTDESASKLFQSLEELNIKPNEIRRILITHGHLDHFGLARELHNLTGAEVFIREEDKLKVCTEYRLFGNNRELVKTTGMPESIINDIKMIETVMMHYREPLDSITTYQGQKTFEFDGFSLEAFHFPGHSSGHTCFYWPAQKILFSGDMILPNITTIPVVDYSINSTQRTLSLKQMLNSLEQLLLLELDYVLPGHGEIISNPHHLIRNRIFFYNKRLEEMYNLLKINRSRSAYELTVNYFGNLSGFDILLALCETIVNLDLLVDRGLVTEDLVEGIIFYSAL